VTLRVHGGEAAGRRLRAPKGIRPSQGVVKEAVFNVLGAAVLDARLLDLFAGSGALGIEALSRGAAHAVFVERSEACASILRQNLDALGYAGRASVVRADALRWLPGHPEEVSAAGIVLLDPPYGEPQLAAALERLDGLVSPGTLVVAEHARRQALPELLRLVAGRQRAYGDTAVTVFRA
jgi:16S rRNA (guanine966-N2)-methyltransferase